MSIDFDPNIYRDNNQDLADLGLTEAELETHFREIGRNEGRIFAAASNLRERFAMRYLRGQGLEVGPGINSFPIYGNSTLEYADVVNESHYETNVNITYSNFQVDCKKLFKTYPQLVNSFDFVVASHVLEHVNSLGLALKNLSTLVHAEGYMYIILPDKEVDWDQFWMKKYSIFHHAIEYFFPKLFLPMHRLSFLKASNRIRAQFESVTDIDTQFSYRSDGAPVKDYVYHKHSYSLYGWVYVLNTLINIFDIHLHMVDVGRCSVRNDVHFMFAKTTKDRKAW